MTRLKRRPRRAGFTLLELLMGAVLASLIVAALADGLGLFSQGVEQVRADSDTGPEEAVALMTDMARYAWVVENPAEGRLDIVDAQGGRTTFALQDGALTLTRPQGASGTLLAGVADLAIQTDSVRRLREAAPVSDYRSWWERPAPEGGLEAFSLESGLSVGLGFTMSSDVPESYDGVQGVHEHALYGALETLVLSLVYVGDIPDDPNEPVSGGEEESGGGGGKKKGKVVICHVPPGNPGNAHTLEVAAPAVDAHLAHGDFLGSCESAPDPGPSAALVVELYEARAPDDARPHGPLLASMSLSTGQLPSGTASWQVTETGAHGSEHDHDAEECAATTPNGKVVICHVPPGNPANAHSITVSPNAVPAHLAHGDYYGCCGQHEDTEDLYTLVIDAAPAEVALDLAPLNALILPGRAYTLVFELDGPGFVKMEGAPEASTVNSGVARSVAAYGELEPAALSVPFRLEGTQAITHTQDHQVVSRVSLALQMAEGKTASGSAAVTSQVTVPGAWLAAVPGQLEDLDQ